MTPLEERYRRLLRLLPAGYQDRWGDDMVQTFLDGMRQPDPDDDELVQELGRPDRSEIVSVVLLAARLRLGAAPGASDRAVSRGEAVRYAVLALAAVHASGAGLDAFALVWRGLTPIRGGWSATAAGLVGILWLPAFLALVFGRLAWARPLIATAVGLTTLLVAADLFHGPAPATWVLLVLDALALVGLVAFEDGKRPVRPRPWLIGLAAGFIGLPGYLLLAVPVHGRPPVLDWYGLICLATVVAAVVNLRTRQAGRRQAVLLLTVGALLLRATSTADYFRFVPAAERTPYLLASATETTLLLAFGVALWWAGVGVGAAGQARVDERG
jgi:hypothetical protein